MLLYGGRCRPSSWGGGVMGVKLIVPNVQKTALNRENVCPLGQYA